MIGTIKVQTTCCKNTAEEAINFCQFLARMGDKYLYSVYSLPSVSLTSNGDNLGSELSVSATEM